MYSTPNEYIELALEYAEIANTNGEVPVGAVLTLGVTGKIIATAGNSMIELGDPTAHAELLVIRKGAQVLGRRHLIDCDLYVTLEPCPMCAYAISLSRIRRLYFGAYDTKRGGIEHGAKIFDQQSCNHCPDVYGGICEKKCSDFLRSFFSQRR